MRVDMVSPPTPAKAPQRIAKLLARAGVASRREVERMIEEGRVAINGVAINTPATLLGSLHGVSVDGVPVAQPAPARLFLYHKPPGLLVTERDPAGRRTIYDRLPADLPRVVPVGRLDLNTEGLLLLTTDGGLKRQLELPVNGVERTYRARAYGEISQATLEGLIDGIEIEGVRYGSIDANLERRTGANVWIELSLTEGKNREVRRVLEHLGLQVSRLIRVRYGPFLLGDLPPGELGEVRQHDLVAFRKVLGLPAAARRFEPIVPVERARPAAAEAAPEAQARAAPRRAATKQATEPEKSRRLGGKLSPRAHKPKIGDEPIAKPARAARARRFREDSGQPPAARTASADGRTAPQGTRERRASTSARASGDKRPPRAPTFRGKADGPSVGRVSRSSSPRKPRS